MVNKWIEAFYRTATLKSLKRFSNIEGYLNLLIHLIENKGTNGAIFLNCLDDSGKRVTLEGMLTFHTYSCNRRAECGCLALIQDQSAKQDADPYLWYTWIKNMLVEFLKRYPKNSRLRLLHGFIQKERLNNKFKAVSEFVLVEKMSHSIQDEVSMYRMKCAIEKSIIEDDIKSTTKQSINVLEVSIFNKKLQTFKETMYRLVLYYIDFWRELLEENPNVAKLHQLGAKVTSLLEMVTNKYNELEKSSPSNPKVRGPYGHFLREVIHNKTDGLRILER
jgi:hypothetical protein